MFMAAFVLAFTAQIALSTAVLTGIKNLALIGIALAAVGLLVLSCDCLMDDRATSGASNATGNPVKRIEAWAAIEHTRVFRSQVLAPAFRCAYVVLSLTLALPSTLIRRRFQGEQDEDKRVEHMSRWLEWYLIVTSRSQSKSCYVTLRPTPRRALRRW